MTHEIEVFSKHFPDASIEALQFGGWRIHTLTGFVEYKDVQFTRIVGGTDVYRGMMLCAKDFGWPFVVLKATEKHKNDKHIVACMAWGREVGIDVVVEVSDEGESILFWLLCFAMWGLGWWLATSWVNPNPWIAMVVSAVATKLAMSKWIEPPWDRWMVRNARQRGQVYRNSLPNQHADVEHPVRAHELEEKFFEP